MRLIREPLSRRTMLRGLGATMALPFTGKIMRRELKTQVERTLP